MYAGLGLSAIVFILHGIFLYGWSVQNQRMSLNWIILMACLNLVGGGIYAARVSINKSRISVFSYLIGS
jgi:adiponectin receptor